MNKSALLNNMQRARYYLLFLSTIFVLFNTIAMAETENALIPARDKENIVNENFSIVTKVSELPLPIKRYIVSQKDLSHPEKSMANPGEPFEIGCNMSFQPNQRLIYAAISQKYCLLYYECGGAMYKRMLEIFRLTHDTAQELLIMKLKSSPNEKPKTIEQLKELL